MNGLFYALLGALVAFIALLTCVVLEWGDEDF